MIPHFTAILLQINIMKFRRFFCGKSRKSGAIKIEKLCYNKQGPFPVWAGRLLSCFDAAEQGFSRRDGMPSLPYN